MAFLASELPNMDFMNWDLNFLDSDPLTLPELPCPSELPILPLPNQETLANILATTPPSSPDSGFPASPEQEDLLASSNVDVAEIRPFIKTESDLTCLSVASPAGSSLKRVRTAGATSVSIPPALVEEQSAKRQRRMLKNRESASLSRKRKKEHMESLEKSVADVTQERDTLAARVATLESENAKLRAELDELRPAKTKMVAGSAATVCLLGVFVLFSLFSSPASSPMLAHSPRGTHALVPMHTGRTLKSLDVVPALSSGLAPRPLPRADPQSDEMDAWMRAQREKLAATAHEVESDNISTDIISLSAQRNLSLPPAIRLSDRSSAALFNSLQRRPDTSYVFCTEVRVVSAPAADGPPRMAVIMPTPRLPLPANSNATVYTANAAQIDCDILQSTPLVFNQTGSVAF